MSKKPSAKPATVAIRDRARQLAIKHASAAKPAYYVEPFEPHDWVVNAIVEALTPLPGFGGREFFRVKDTATNLYRCAGENKWSNGGKTWNKLGHVKASLRMNVAAAEHRNWQREHRAKTGTPTPAWFLARYGADMEKIKLPDTWVIECHNSEGGWIKSANEVMGLAT